MWYRDWFKDENYSTVYEHRDEIEAEQIIELIESVTGNDRSRRVLDLACGSGRHAISFAKRGYSRVTGVDLSPTLLREAESDSKAFGLSIEFLERDMRDVPNEPFDLVLNLFTSFGYFGEDSENEEVIRNVAGALSESGYFIIDFFNSNFVRSHLVSHDERHLPDGGRLEQTRWIENGRVEKRLLIRQGEEAREYVESVRLYDLAHFETMLQNAGLKLTNLFGSYTGAPFDENTSRRLIMFARK